MTISAMPIMVFDERRLAPSFGYYFDEAWLYPDESIISILWKFARMNSLPGHVLAARVAKKRIDPYDGMPVQRELVDMEALREATRLRLKTLRGSMPPRRRYYANSSYFRYCSPCINLAYHSVVHQLELIHHCPIHGKWLQTQCRHCGYATPYRINAHVLDFAFRCGQCRQWLGTSPTPLQPRKLRSQFFTPITRQRALRIAI